MATYEEYLAAVAELNKAYADAERLGAVFEDRVVKAIGDINKNEIQFSQSKGPPDLIAAEIVAINKIKDEIQPISAQQLLLLRQSVETVDLMIENVTAEITESLEHVSDKITRKDIAAVVAAKIEIADLKQVLASSSSRREIDSKLNSLNASAEALKESRSSILQKIGFGLGAVIGAVVALVSLPFLPFYGGYKLTGKLYKASKRGRSASAEESEPLLSESDRVHTSDYKAQLTENRTAKVNGAGFPKAAFPGDIATFKKAFTGDDIELFEFTQHPDKDAFTIKSRSSDASVGTKIPDVQVSKDQVSVVLSGSEDYQQLADIMIRGAMAAGMNVKTLEISGGTQEIRAALEEAKKKFADPEYGSDVVLSPFHQ